MKKIVLITSGQPSLNPRLVKEADALVESGYAVCVIYQFWNKWGTELDKELLNKKKWSFKCVGGSINENKLLYWFTRIQFKTGRLLAKKIGFKFWAEIAIGRCTKQLIKESKNIKADLYIAHNLAALPAAIIAAKKNKAKCGFDAEDFHRNEQFDDIENFDVKLKTYIENKYIPQLNYISTSSPQINKAYQNLYLKHKPITVLNVFPKQNFVVKNTVSDQLKLFWFSQTIGSHRGIETVIKAMAILANPKLELHLLGFCTDETKASFKKLAKINGLLQNAIFYYNPIPADDIFYLEFKFDIGLATEISDPFNRDICLTNKIFTYIQSSLAIIASDTKAQSSLMDEYPNMGMIYKKDDAISLSEKIKNYLENPELLVIHQQQAYKYASEVLNWEVEKEKFLSIVKQTLAKD